MRFPRITLDRPFIIHAFGGINSIFRDTFEIDFKDKLLTRLGLLRSAAFFTVWFYGVMWLGSDEFHVDEEYFGGSGLTFAFDNFFVCFKWFFKNVPVLVGV